MSTDTANAVMNFSGGALVFAAASLPLIKYIFTKAMAVADKDRMREIAVLIFTLLVFMVGFSLYYFSSMRLISVVIIFFFVVLRTVSFTTKKAPLRRSEIFFDAILPGLLFVFMFATSYAEDLVRHIAK
jgi:hypothetical protein